MSSNPETNVCSRAVTASTAPGRAPSRAEVTAAIAGPPMAFLDVGHSRLAYYRFGSGPDLVFVHGWPLHAATFRALVPLLAADFTCHLFDLPGTGQTISDADAPIDMTSHVATVRRAVDALGIERYAFLAHDSGAFFARLVAASDPRVVGLCLGNTEIPGHEPWLLVLLAALVKLPAGWAIFRRLFASRFVRRSFLGLGGCFADRDLLDGEFHELFVRDLLSEETARGQMRLLDSLGSDSTAGLREAHARITAKTLLIWGEDDPFFPIDKARAMVGELPPGTELVPVANAKVFVHEEQPEIFASHARRFLCSAFAMDRPTAALRADRTSSVVA